MNHIKRKRILKNHKWYDTVCTPFTWDLLLDIVSVSIIYVVVSCSSFFLIVHVISMYEYAMMKLELKLLIN